MSKRKRTNRIIADHGDWLEIDISTPKHPEAVMKIDKADWDSIKSLGAGRVFACDVVRGLYAYAYVWPGGKLQIVHRLLMVDKSKVIDHINHETLDNRRSNTRECTQSQNKQNSRVYTNNKSGCAGVHRQRVGGKWIARVKLDGKFKYIGIFDDISDAISARKKAERKFYGEYSYEASMGADEINV